MSEIDPELALILSLGETARAVTDGTLTGAARDEVFEILGNATDRYLAEHPLPE
jgi:hypothetical protein